MHRGKQVTGEFARLAEIEEQYFGLAEGEAFPVGLLQAVGGGLDDEAGVVGGVWKLDADALRESGFGGVEHAGADVDLHAFAVRALGAELFAGAGGVGGHGFADRREFVQALAEHSGAADFLLGWCGLLGLKAGDAAQFAGGLPDDDVELFAQGPGVGLGEVPGCLDALSVEVFGHAPTDAPDVAGLQQAVAARWVAHIEHAAGLALPLLGAVVGELCQGLGRGDADADGDAGATQPPGAHLPTEAHQVAGDAGELGEAFVDAVDLHRRRHLLEDGHDACAHVAVYVE